VAGDRQKLRRTFDSAADQYQDARPEYPQQLFETLVRVAGLGPGDRLLEVGCATGKATLPLARRGFRISCVEIGPQLAAVARNNLVDFADVSVIEGAFETWKPPTGERFDLVFAATAWHWLDPAVRYEQAWRLLRPGGLPDDREEIERTGLFEDVVVHHFDWEVTYNAHGYLRLLDTFSGHIAMQPWQRDRLYGEIRRRLAMRPDGRLRRHWGAVLRVARRTSASRVP
jgi:SAM-dependent methyltransferase